MSTYRTDQPLWKRLNLSSLPDFSLHWQPTFTYLVVILVITLGLAFFLTSQVSEIYTTNLLEQWAIKAQWTA